MLIKVHYAGGYTDCVDSGVLSSVSLTEYTNFQFQGDEYSLRCESIELVFRSKSFPSSQERIRKSYIASTSLNQTKKSLQTVGRL